MSTCIELADVEWLTGDEAGAILADLANDTGQLHSVVARLRRRLTATQTHLLVEQVELRRRATAKFTHPERLFFTRLGLEQSTDEWVAAYKAARFAPRAGASSPTISIADLCCGIGGDLMALSKAAPNTIAVDRDPITAHFAAINSGAKIHTVDIADFCFDDISAWHIDPDRRPTGQRTTSLEHCEPDLATIERLLAQAPNAAIKLAPATKPPADWADRCELEWISRDGECKQLVAWHGALAVTPTQRRATMITSACRPALGSSKGGLAPRTICGAANTPVPITTQPDRYIHALDSAVTAARLTGILAAEHNLSALSTGPTYLTGPTAIVDPALACFEVTEILPMRVPVLSQHLRAQNIGHLEIKKRGVEIAPEKLRRDLKLKGSNSATLLITQIAAKPTAILAQRVTPHLLSNRPIC
jgi:hypothetical protein